MSIFPKSEQRILSLIYENPGIRLSELIKKAKASAGTAKKRLEHLLNMGIIKEEVVEGGKRIILKTFYPNLSKEEGKSVFSLIEAEKRENFLRKNRNLEGAFKQLLRNLEKEIKIILVFGSFADDSQTKDSDLDILFLIKGKITKDLLKKEIERSFVTFEHEVSPKIETVNNFKNNLNKGIYQTIVKNHVVMKGALDFIELLK